MISLKGKIALITGASRGIGRATALLFAQAGADLVLSYRTQHAAAEEVAKAVRALGSKCLYVPGDISRPEVVEQLFALAQQQFGRLDIVVVNAGIWTEGAIDQLTPEVWQETMEVNLTSAYLCCHWAAKIMKPQRSGTIILVSSTAGQRGEAYHSHYAASKSALHGFAKSLAAELGPSNITVNVVAPGWVDTDMSREALNGLERQRIFSAIPLGRVATAEDVAGPILFLASPLARHITGAILSVNGGSVLSG
ncbi:MAG: SDR family oxidoreductase [Deinococcus sp.]|nr:SDR family oxidoreductase [Deinococcus sp.]